MNCEKISHAWIAYLDGKASPQERAAVESHLQTCAACQERADEYRRLWQVMGEAGAVEPSLGFDARLRDRIAAQPKPKFWNSFLPAPRFSFALALLLLLCFWVGTQPQRTANPVPNQANSGEQFQMINNLGVLENYDVLSNFDALSDLPSVQETSDGTEQAPPAKRSAGGGQS